MAGLPRLHCTMHLLIRARPVGPPENGAQSQWPHGGKPASANGMRRSRRVHGISSKVIARTPGVTHHGAVRCDLGCHPGGAGAWRRVGMLRKIQDRMG